MRRRAGEAMLIGEDIEIVVIEVAGSRVKLGIRAPASVTILRKEIQLAASENMAAAGSVSPRDVSHLLDVLRARQAQQPVSLSSVTSPAGR